MPIYQYVCEDCGKEFEIIRKFSEKDDPLPEEYIDDDCDHRCIKSIMGQSSFRLKGKWFKQGY